jgi:hypothetical protein
MKENAMKPVIFLRAASGLTLLHAVLHTVGGVFGKPVPGVGAATEAVMRANYFLVLGVTRSYWEFYRGMGLGITISLTAEGIVFWMLGSLAKQDAARLRPILWVFALAYLVFAVNSYEYFFSGPVIAEVLIAACFLGAIATAKTAEASHPIALRAEARAGD